MIPTGLMQASLPFVAGWARDRGVKPKWMVLLSSYQTALSAYLATTIDGPLLAILFGLNFGSVWCVKMTVSGMIYADFYGRASLGAIQSVDVTWHMVGTATGPLIAAFLREYYGSFPPVYLTLMLLPLLSGTLALFLRPPPRRRGD